MDQASQASAQLGERVTRYFLKALQELDEALKSLEEDSIRMALPAPEDLAHYEQMLHAMRPGRRRGSAAAAEVLARLSSALKTMIFAPAPAMEEQLEEARSRLEAQEAADQRLDEHLEQVTCELTKEKCKAWSIALELGEPLVESERLARQHLLAGRVSQGAILEVLRAVVFPNSDGRPGTRGKVPTITLGLVQWAHFQPSICSDTSKNRYLFRLLGAFFRSSYENGQAPPCTTITVAKVATHEHTDDNLGNTRTISLGEQLEGGRLFVVQEGLVEHHEDDEAHEHVVEIECSRRGHKSWKKGEVARGMLLKTHGVLREFNPLHMHFTEPYEGERYCLSYYICRAVQDGLEKSWLGELTSAGLLYPTDEQIKKELTEKTNAALYRKVCYPKPSQANGRKRMRGKAPCEELQSLDLTTTESPAHLLPCQREARALLEVNSNYRGGGGAEMFQRQSERLQLRLSKLSSELAKERIGQLLKKMVPPPQGTLQLKTPSTWRVYVLEILSVLEAEDLKTLREVHRLQDKQLKQSKDVRKSLRAIEEIKASWTKSKKRKA